jgi:transcriptional regulator with XRE-family HTH domain
MARRSTSVVPLGLGQAEASLVGARLREIRGPRDQRAFAQRLAVPQQTVSKYEGGAIPRSWDFLARLHDEEGIDLNDLLTRKNGAEP